MLSGLQIIMVRAFVVSLAKVDDVSISYVLEDFV